MCVSREATLKAAAVSEGDRHVLDVDSVNVRPIRDWHPPRGGGRPPPA